MMMMMVGVFLAQGQLGQRAPNKSILRKNSGGDLNERRTRKHTMCHKEFEFIHSQSDVSPGN